MFFNNDNVVPFHHHRTLWKVLNYVFAILFALSSVNGFPTHLHLPHAVTV